MSGKKPNLIVMARSLGDSRIDERFWKQIGVAWTNTGKDGVKYIRVALDFMPNERELTIWPAGTTEEDATRFSRVAEEMEGK